MPRVTVTLDAETECFYRQIAQQLSLPLEQVLSDALFRLAGELALEALSHTL